LSGRAIDAACSVPESEVFVTQLACAVTAEIKLACPAFEIPAIRSGAIRVRGADYAGVRAVYVTTAWRGPARARAGSVSSRTATGVPSVRKTVERRRIPRRAASGPFGTFKALIGRAFNFKPSAGRAIASRGFIIPFKVWKAVRPGMRIVALVARRLNGVSGAGSAFGVVKYKISVNAGAGVLDRRVFGKTWPAREVGRARRIVQG